MHRTQNIAFIKWGEFSHTNASVLEILTANFPNYRVETLDLSDLITTRDPLTILHCLRTYGGDIWLGRKSLARAILKTPHVFDKVRRAVRARLTGANYAFTFQTQSVFDASAPGIPHFVYTDHTHLANLSYPGFDPRQLLAKSWIEREKTIYGNATLNFTMSTNISASIVEDYACDPEKVACVYCGANVSVAKDEVFDDRRFSSKNILFVGNDWARKGGPALVDAFKRVLDVHPGATLTIVGCAPRVDLPNCNVVGRVPLPDVKKHFERAAVFCLPTTVEPFGIVFLEAMAHGLPVIGTKIGAVPDFVLEGKNGYLIEPNDSPRLAEKIIELLDSPGKCKAFGECGRALFWDRYTWEKTGERIRRQIEGFLA
jgi:glycosyltransferase involved in cell wall biosynthesis